MKLIIMNTMLNYLAELIKSTIIKIMLLVIISLQLNYINLIIVFTFKL